MRLPIAKIENVTGPDHDVLSNVYFDKEHSELIASDEFTMVVIPVDSGKEDVSGCIPVGVVEFAHRHHVDIKLHDSERAEVQMAKGILWQKRHEGYPKDTMRRIISDVLASEDDCVVVSLDVNQLVRLAEALLDESCRDDCRITLKIRGGKEPVLVRPFYNEVQDGRLGIIMPLAGGGGK